MPKKPDEPEKRRKRKKYFKPILIAYGLLPILSETASGTA